ncbi:unnamed protein product [Moneuplotes crassus]|uniref:Uncharacterized protein n=1 Tax=Euplotes crassus TaxID=5936 RepID=A0AAD1XSQ7_EUPCR|nr:unnamed protein product [Moneuplotes crassus]
MEDEDDYDYKMKIIFTGDMGVGKTKIIQRYTRKMYYEKDMPATIGVEFHWKRVYLKDEDVKIKALIWDTSGSERYRAVTVGHYRDSLGAVLVFDITDANTFESLDFWLKDLKRSVRKECVMALLPNKIDLISGNSEKRQVSEEQIVEFAKKNGLLYLGECSAKDDINVTETLDQLVFEIKEKQKFNLHMINSISNERVTLQAENKFMCGSSDSCFGC